MTGFRHEIHGNRAHKFAWNRHFLLGISNNQYYKELDLPLILHNSRFNFLVFKSSKNIANLNIFISLYINMETETFYFWGFCLFSLFLGKAISTYLFPEPAKFLEAYGGCECGDEDCKKN